MVTHYDHKGKYFTNVVAKDVVRATVQTLTVRFVGDVHVTPDKRLKDELNKSEQFIAITDVTVYNKAGKQIYQTDFLAVNKDQIVWVNPEYDDEREQE